jgi:hypothetical protein
MKLKFSPQIKKKLKYQTSSKFVHADGHTERYVEANNRVSQFCESAWKHFLIESYHLFLADNRKYRKVARNQLLRRSQETESQPATHQSRQTGSLEGKSYHKILTFTKPFSRDSSVRIVPRLQDGWSGVRSPAAPSLIFGAYRGSPGK